MTTDAAPCRIAWLQRAFVLLALMCSAGWWIWCRSAGLGPLWWVIGWSVTLLPHAWVLAIEFILMRSQWPQPRPVALPRLVNAWRGEVIAGLRVFAWNQPFRHRAVDDCLRSKRPGLTGVVLIHGFVCNRGFWNPWLRALQREGRAVVAVTLEPVFGSIDAYRDTIDCAVVRMNRATGRAPWVVAHSMGGLALRSWLRDSADERRIAGAMTIGTPHHGTWLARLGFSRNTKQMQRDSPWLRRLFEAEPAGRYARFVCVYSDCDNIVFPVRTATLPGAEPMCIHGAGHVDLVFRPEVIAELQRRLLLSDGS